MTVAKYERAIAEWSRALPAFLYEGMRASAAALTTILSEMGEEMQTDIKASVKARISAHVDVYIRVRIGTQPEDGIGSIQLSISNDVPN